MDIIVLVWGKMVFVRLICVNLRRRIIRLGRLSSFRRRRGRGAIIELYTGGLMTRRQTSICSWSFKTYLGIPPSSGWMAYLLSMGKLLSPITSHCPWGYFIKQNNIHTCHENTWTLVTHLTDVCVDSAFVFSFASCYGLYTPPSLQFWPSGVFVSDEYALSFSERAL